MCIACVRWKVSGCNNTCEMVLGRMVGKLRWISNITTEWKVVVKGNVCNNFCVVNANVVIFR